MLGKGRRLPLPVAQRRRLSCAPDAGPSFPPSASKLRAPGCGSQGSEHQRARRGRDRDSLRATAGEARLEAGGDRPGPSGQKQESPGRGGSARPGLRGCGAPTGTGDGGRRGRRVGGSLSSRPAWLEGPVPQAPWAPAWAEEAGSPRARCPRASPHAARLRPAVPRSVGQKWPAGAPVEPQPRG